MVSRTFHRKLWHSPQSAQQKPWAHVYFRVHFFLSHFGEITCVFTVLYDVTSRGWVSILFSKHINISTPNYIHIQNNGLKWWLEIRSKFWLVLAANLVLTGIELCFQTCFDSRIVDTQPWFKFRIRCYQSLTLASPANVCVSLGKFLLHFPHMQMGIANKYLSGC